MVPRSVSRVTASEVISTMVMVRITPSRPGTMLYAVMPSGLNRRWMTTSKGGTGTRSGRSCRSAEPASCDSAATALEVAAGSVASASMRSCGRAPFRRSAEKPSGMVTTKAPSPSATRRSAARSPSTLATMLK